MSQTDNYDSAPIAADAPTLAHWLREAAKRRPDGCALQSAETQLSYAHLLERTLALAEQIRQADLRAGDRIAIAAIRSIDTIVAILATVEAGLGYVPLDLNYPADRLQAMLEDAKPRLVLGEASALAQLRAAVGDFPTLASPAPCADAPHAAAPDLTYVLFTSGSTGRPKGVAMGAAPLRHLIAWHAAHPRLAQAARVLQFAPLSFDVHFQEIFSTLACGGTLVLVPEAQRRDPTQLLAALNDFRIERIFVPYVALQMLADAARNHAPTALRDVISAGEQLQVTPAIRSLFERLPGSELHNHYGPTESHVVTAFELKGDPAAWPVIPPIGRALPHAKLALLSSSVAESDEIGTTGELLLGGETLAHGYLGRPELTAERFRNDVVGMSDRWYVTGDLVRCGADGIYTYLGRADQQLKVDGFRIEPGEIELAMMAHAGVKDAVVTAPDLPGIGKQLVAHLVLRDADADASRLITQVRAHLRASLPEYMVPVRYVTLDRLPTTPSGKIDRRSLPLPALESTVTSATDPLEATRALWQELLGLPQIGDEQNLFDLGARSLLVMRFITRLKDLGISGVSVADVYDRPTVAGIAAAMGGQKQSRKRPLGAQTPSTTGIAIVGMASRTPGAGDVESFWQNLVAGREGIRHFSPSELDPSVPESLRTRPNFVAAHGVLDDADRFDAAYFGISAREATMLDPQQRLMLEMCTSALEHAAIDPSRGDVRVGVYAGTGNNAYSPALRDEQPELVRQYGEFATMLASEKDYVATRVANRLNLNGPALSIHTACSTSLVAVAQAWHGLASGQCDLALAGGANVAVPQISGYLHVEGGMESADGHCRPFDAEASGTVFSSGGGIVVLKRLEDALADGDTIYAVIRGVGLNNDGGDKASFTAPSVTGQATAIRMALEHAQCDARSIGYVEAHGTGTALGDPIEVAALTRAWREDTADSQFCGIGSVKSNLGHMAAGAGVVGLIKAALSLYHELIPGTLHYRSPNPQIDFPSTPFKVVAQNTAWSRSAEVRRAAVSSFGVGGTNAHVVIEEAPASAHAPVDDGENRQLLPLSARTAEATLQRARDLADHLERHPEVALTDIAATLMRGRKAMAHRLSVVASNANEAVGALRAAKSATAALQRPRLVFLFPGQGSQHPGMVGGLYDEAPAFREAFDRCMAIANPALGVDLRAWLLNADPSDAALAQALAETRHAQPALFSVSYALAAWLDSLGLRADAMIGHSIGEYAAACHAGVFSLDDAVNAVIARGQAMFDQPRGAMLAVRSDAEAVRALLPAGVEIAGCNAPALTVVAGSHEAVDAFARQLESNEVGTTKLRVSHAFHSASMEGALPRVVEALQRARLQAPRNLVYSCISGAPLQAEEATDPQYWARQVRAPVQFSKAISAELARGDCVFVEVGPGQALTALLRQHRTAAGTVPRNVALLGPAQEPGHPAQHALAGIGAMWCAGVEIAWPVAASARRLALPTYPFHGERYWFKRRVAAIEAVAVAPAAIATAPVIPTQTPEIAVTMSRLPVLEAELKRVLSDVSGLPADEMTPEATFVDQGLDSLSLTQATLELERVFGVKLRFRRLLEDLDNIGKLAQFLDGEIPADKFAPPTPTPVPAQATVIANAASEPAAVPAAMGLPQAGTAQATMPPMSLALQPGASAVHQLMQQQMQLMSQQLAVLAGQSLANPLAAAATVPAALPLNAAAALRGSGTPAVQPTAAAAAAPGAAAGRAPAPAKPRDSDAEADQPNMKSLVEKPFGASPRLTLEAKQDFTPAQRRWLDDFIARYTARSGKSRSFSQQHRKVMADPRVVTGFNPLWKDLVYPIVVDKSQGASLWDLDGNEYIDLLSCFGGNLLGYQPPDVIEAMAKQLQLGLEVGPQHPMAAEVAQLISEFTGMERVAFCNTGSEAVMGAMRIARTVTGRKTIAIFTNSYHGIFDEVIVRGSKQLRSLSAAPGILANAVENILVLDWNSEDSLRVLRERGSELAAIMTEPIQNKYPTLQPREFVQSLRQIADKAGCALIFDEVVTGFRVAPGGAQEFYGVRADIATYGKVIGGGLPFAAIAGRSKWLDALDGGHWQYGDDSYPEAGVTYFAGTFVRHPLALAAARATLLHLKRGGREFYRCINDRTQRLVDRLNTAFAVRGAPVKAVHCASLWRLQWDDNLKFVSLFYYLVRYHGLHLYEQFGHFVTELMTDEHTDRIFKVFTDALDELMGLGLIPPREGGPSPAGGPETGGKRLTQAQLSPGQTERWLAGGFDAAARRALNESFCVSLRGSIDKGALRLALQDVLTRHDAFRVRFDTEQPQQTLGPAGPVKVTEIDLRSQADSDAALDAFCTEASSRDFPIDKSPLAAVSLLTLGDGRVVVHVVASHLVFDGWASSVFNAELATAYTARSMGMLPQFKPAESPLEFAEQEQARFEGPEGQEALRFWREQLRNPPAQLNLGDRAPTTPRRYAADTLRVRLDGELFARLRAHARQSGATLFQLLLTAVTMMLQRRSGQAEFVVSIPYASQSLQRRGPLMGDGVLDLPIRLGCSAGEPAAVVLQRVRSRLMDALEHPLMTQGTVARALGIRSAGDRPPLTGIYFNLNPRVDLSGYAPLVATMHEGRKAGTLSELFFNFYEQDDALTLDLHYSSEFYSPARAQEVTDALMHQCRSLAGATESVTPAATQPRPEVSPPVSLAAAIDQRLVDWNARTAAPMEAHARVEQWISRQAAASPDAVALIANGVTLTYRAMESRANRFANLLKLRGIGAGMRVGVCLTRGPDLVPALLGVLKTGAAYVPLDPGFPKDRLHYMAEDAGVRLVITDAANAVLSGVSREQQLRIDDDAEAIASASDTALPAGTDWADDATMYVIYTSGSTGKPKGVVLPQNAVCNFLASMRREPGLLASDRLMAVTTLSFDIAVLELYLPLTVGARVVLAQREDAMDGEVLARMINDQGINVMQATPTSWHMLLDAGWRAPTGFKALCGGEPLPPSLAKRMLEAGVELWNMYGPTETTVWSTLCHITDAQQKITIGRPIANTQVWVLDEKLRPCPIGAEGELCIGGAGVATGYFNRPELTAEKFISDPFNRTPGARIYRTGDLSRWRDDGTIEHLGRLDFQVKIRGYRIELGEIEARLAALPGVARTVVVAREDNPGDVRLVGYFVAQPNAQPDSAQLRESLRTALPDYMLPQHIVAMDTLPLLPNGKIDRKALPAPVGPAQASHRQGETPRTELEFSVAKAMEAVLKLAAVGVDDDFFSLGGHSLLAARLIGQLNRDLQLQLGLRVLFEAPTVSKLAQAIEQLRGGPAAVPRAPIVHVADQRTAPLTMMQERIRFVEEMYPGRVVYNAPSAHRLKGLMDPQAFDKAFAQMVQRQPSLRTRIVAGPNGYVQQIDDSLPVSLLPLEDLSALPDPGRESALCERLNSLVDETFDLAKGPLFKARLFKLAEDHHALFFMPHHIIWDGWSFDILYTEIAALYEAALDGREPDLPAPGLSYADFARWHNQWLDSEEIQGQVKYWKSQYAQGTLPRDPYVDLPRQPDSSGRGATMYMHIEPQKAERVRDLAKQTGSTLSIVALSIYAAMMSQWLNDPRPTIGIPIRGRPSADLDGIMGFFNNMLPMRLQVDTSMSGLDWIKAVRQMLVQAYANQDVPFELLAKELELNRGGAPTRLYQVMFSFQDARQRPEHWGPLAHERIKVFHRGSTEDINLWMVEIPDGISVGLQYNSDLFLPETATLLRDRFLSLLDELTRDPSRDVTQLLAIRPAERAQIEQWSQLALPGREPVDVMDRLTQRFASHASSPALRDDSSSLSLADLGQRVKAFEASLRHQLAGQDSLVAIGVDDPVAHLVACLAALYCEARILVFDPALHGPSLEALLRANNATAIISDTAPADPAANAAHWIDANQIPGVRPARRSRSEAESGIDTPQAAQVVLDRIMLTSLLAALSGKARVLESDRLLILDGPARGLHLVQAMLALTEGAELLFAHSGLAQDGAALAARIRDERIGWLHAPGATWKNLLAASLGSSLPIIAMIDVTESTPDLVSALVDAGSTVLTLLRPTAHSVPVAAGLIADPKDHALFGNPLLRGTLDITDAQGQLLAPGMAGQLHVHTGPTAAAPTGLLARWRSDGALQYLGPMGDNAFIEGCRIAPSMLEKQLKTVPGVRDAGISVLDDVDQHRILCAWVQPDAEVSLDLAECSDRLSRLLPGGILNQRVIAVEQIARFADGSLDTKMMSRQRNAVTRAQSHAPVLSSTEQALIEVWQELLAVPHVHPQDNFFELGGTSLTAMQAVLKLEQKIGKQVSPRRYVIETLAQLAAAYDNEVGAEQPPPQVESAPRQGVMRRLAKLVQRA
jgi:amino acid adenylation domain-containing protein